MHRIKTEELDTAAIAAIRWMFDDKDVNIHYLYVLFSVLTGHCLGLAKTVIV